MNNFEPSTAEQSTSAPLATMQSPLQPVEDQSPVAPADHHLPTFHNLGLIAPLTRALTEEGYTTPTPIQAQTIPFALSGRDVIGIAQTGTGKTAAFALPILQRLSATTVRPRRKGCRVLVLSPTRELSGQIAESFRTYGRHLRLSVALAIGGVPIGKQMRSLLNGVDVLVATPGRVLDLIKSNALFVNETDVLVLDEADRMLDMGFIHDIRTVVAKLPKERQTLFFSATMPKEIADLAAGMLRDPARVAVTPVASTVERITQRIMFVERAAKPMALVNVLKEETIDRVLVFSRTKHGADKIVHGLEKNGIDAAALHGNKSQNQRERVLDSFRTGRLRIVVATDIAARGIDVDGISHVVNYDLPDVPESYVHRIGRTARAGADGIAISFCAMDERHLLRAIEKTIRKSLADTGADIGNEPPRQQQHRRGGGGRPNHSSRPQRDGRNSRPAHARGQDKPAHAQGPRGNGASHEHGKGQANGHNRDHGAPRNHGDARHGDARHADTRGHGGEARGRGNGNGQANAGAQSRDPAKPWQGRRPRRQNPSQQGHSQRGPSQSA